jgi:hypothetical protein
MWVVFVNCPNPRLFAQVHHYGKCAWGASQSILAGQGESFRYKIHFPVWPSYCVETTLLLPACIENDCQHGEQSADYEDGHPAQDTALAVGDILLERGFDLLDEIQ